MTDRNAPTVRDRFDDWWADDPDPVTIKRKWERLPDDPEMTDLGYQAVDLDLIETNTPPSQVLVLPHDEDLIRDDAYLIADAAWICDPVELR